MSIIQFSETDRPGDESFTGTDDLSCEVCGAPLIYAGKGRKPKYCDEHKSTKSSGSSTRSSKGSADVELAVQSLHTLYQSLLLPLMAVSPAAAARWDREIAGLDERNRTFLATNKDLVKKINSAAAKGGSTAFMLSHVMAVAPVTMILWQEHAMRAAAKRAAHTESEEPDYSDPETMFAS